MRHFILNFQLIYFLFLHLTFFFCLIATAVNIYEVFFVEYVQKPSSYRHLISDYSCRYVLK
jgi:hypothetical protein